LSVKKQLGLGSMKFAPGTPRSVAEAALIRAGYPAPRRPGPKSFVMDTTGVDPRSYDAFPRATDYAPGVSVPVRASEPIFPGATTTAPGVSAPKKNNFGTRIDLPAGTIVTQEFLDSDRDGVDDRYQTGPGMPDSRGVKPPGKTIIDKGTSNSQPMSSSYRSVKDSGFDPAAYGNPDIGLKDVYELRKRGFNRKEIQDYVDYKKKGGMNIGARVQGGLSLMGTKGDKKGSIADSGYSYKDFGDGKGVGFHDLVELTGRGYGKQQIADYIEGQRKQGTAIGGAVADLMGLVGPVGGREKPKPTPTPTPTPTPAPTKIVNKEVSSGNKGQGAGSTVDNRINIKAAPAMKAPAAAPMAGAKFGLAPTEVVEQTRGRGYGLTYSPQQRDAQTVKYGGGPQNVINFNPNMVQQANPNINVAGSKAVNKPITTNTNVTESGKGGIRGPIGGGDPQTGGGGGGLPDITIPVRPGKPGGGRIPSGGSSPGSSKPIKPSSPGGGKNYRRKMDRYMRKFDRTADGAGSKRGVDRFSAKDIRTMFKAGRKRGGSKKQVARDVLAYARRNRNKTKMGGSAKKQLDKLQKMLGARRKEEKKRKSMTAKQQRKLDRKQRKRAKKKVRKYLKRRRNKRRNKRNR
tara:strand:+ start:2147 stop:4033 length:1887 start_codon:yes stop_codon:yes gene_type:complete